MNKPRVPLNIPNLLTFFRLALVPVAIWTTLEKWYVISLAIFLVACITDLLDGKIARKYNMVSEAGIVLDPLADKVMAVSMVIVFTVQEIYPLWVSVVIFAKEAILIGAGIYLYIRKVVLPANTFGKIASFAFNTAIAFTLFYRYMSGLFGWTVPADLYFMYFALGLMVVALLQYAYFNAYKKYILVKKQAGEHTNETNDTEKESQQDGTPKDV